MDVVTTGAEKTRFTLAITISSSGEVLPGFRIFKGLKKIHNCVFPANIIPETSQSGTMNTELMLKYINSVLQPRVSQFRDEYGQIKPTLLLMDAHVAHELTGVVKLILI